MCLQSLWFKTVDFMNGWPPEDWSAHRSPVDGSSCASADFNPLTHSREVESRLQLQNYVTFGKYVNRFHVFFSTLFTDGIQSSHFRNARPTTTRSLSSQWRRGSSPCQRGEFLKFGPILPEVLPRALAPLHEGIHLEILFRVNVGVRLLAERHADPESQRSSVHPRHQRDSPRQRRGKLVPPRLPAHHSVFRHPEDKPSRHCDSVKLLAGSLVSCFVLFKIPWPARRLAADRDLICRRHESERSN